MMIMTLLGSTMTYLYLHSYIEHVGWGKNSVCSVVKRFRRAVQMWAVSMKDCPWTLPFFSFSSCFVMFPLTRQNSVLCSILRSETKNNKRRQKMHLQILMWSEAEITLINSVPHHNFKASFEQTSYDSMSQGKKRGERRGQQGYYRRRPPLTSLPGYILFPIGIFGGSILYTYWYFQDEAPFTKRKRLLATVSYQLILCCYTRNRVW